MDINEAHANYVSSVGSPMEDEQLTKLLYALKPLTETVVVKVLHRRDDALAWELAEDVCLKMHGFKGGSKFTTWAWVVSYHRLIANARKGRIEEVVEVPEEIPARVGHLLGTDVRAVVRRNGTPGDIALLDCVLLGMTTREIAQALNKPHGTVKSDKARLVSKMRRWLKDGKVGKQV